MNKNIHLRKWLWKWHILAGLVCLPFLLLLSVTGIIYLFKDNYNNMAYYTVQHVEMDASDHKILSLSQQLSAATEYTEKDIVGFVLPSAIKAGEIIVKTTEFHESTKGRAKNRIYVNPVTAEVTGKINQKDTFMYKVRKLHGELLLNKPGTLLIEFVGSWFAVLIVTGLYVWWPRKNQKSGLFKIRRKDGNKAFRRDMHVVLSFWISIFLLIILAGGMPWTDVFGGQLKWVQAKTDTGYPQSWNAPIGVQSQFSVQQRFVPLPLEDIARIAKEQQLLGKVTITLPKGDDGVYKIANNSFWLSDQKVIYVDQYSGKIIKSHMWQEVGILMDLRQVFMRLHQGQYGSLNWFVLLFTVQIFIISSFSALISYIRRKPQNSWGLPSVPDDFKVNKLLMIIIVAMGVILPMFGISLLVMISIKLLMTIKKKLIA